MTTTIHFTSPTKSYSTTLLEKALYPQLAFNLKIMEGSHKTLSIQTASLFNLLEVGSSLQVKDKASCTKTK
jgi:hypothetical protein